MKLGYDYRTDGMFLCRVTCRHCGEEFEMLALANARYYCDACEAMRDWERRGTQAEKEGR